MPRKPTQPDTPAGQDFPSIRKLRPAVLLGVTGGIAAYKAVDLASKLTSLGATLKTVMTENASRFVGPKSFEAVTRSAVFTDMWSPPQTHSSAHISLADWAELVLVAPATANIIGKAASGICDDLLSTILCAASAKPKLLAPAMNVNMWVAPAVQRNVRFLQGHGFEMVGPVEGRLADGTIGMGRMAEPLQIIEAVEKILSVTRPGKE